MLLWVFSLGLLLLIPLGMWLLLDAFPIPGWANDHTIADAGTGQGVRAGA